MKILSSYINIKYIYIIYKFKIFNIIFQYDCHLYKNIYIFHLFNIKIYIFHSFNMHIEINTLFIYLLFNIFFVYISK